MRVSLLSVEVTGVIATILLELMRIKVVFDFIKNVCEIAKH